MINYYGRFYRSALSPLVARQHHLRRWLGRSTDGCETTDGSAGGGRTARTGPTCSSTGVDPHALTADKKSPVTRVSRWNCGRGAATSPATRPSSGCLRRWLDDFGDDPAVLADLAVGDESQLVVGREGAVEQEAGRNRTGRFGVALTLPPPRPAISQRARAPPWRRPAAVPVPTVAAIRQLGKVVRFFS